MLKINLKQDPNYIEDLRDDLMINSTLSLYDFVGKDLVKCYYTGFILPELLKELPLEKYYLYSKSFRHVQDNLEKYETQLEFWQQKYYNENDEVSTLEVLSYVLNNFFFDSTEDAIDMAIYLGKYSYFKQHKDDKVQSEENSIERFRKNVESNQG